MKKHPAPLFRHLQPISAALGIALLTATPGARADDSQKAKPAKPRQTVWTKAVSYPPLFVDHAETLDPAGLAREAWEGYVSKKGDPWGLTPDLKPTLRLSFDCRALPWPSIKHNPVDGLDNNGRGVGAHALLHAMFGAEKNNDPAETGQMAYLDTVSDPATGLAFLTENMSRGFPIAEGEMANNLMMLSTYAGEPEMRAWAEKLIRTLRRYAVVKDWPGVGPMAFYPMGGIGVDEPTPTEVGNMVDPGYYPPGWNIIAFSRWYEMTGDTNALEFAVALANRLCHSIDTNGDDGALHPDGSFGGKTQKYTLSLHMHGHTHTLPGLLHLGSQLVKDGQRDKALAMIGQARATFDWLYDPTRNPDAGSLTGWLGEWLMVATGWNRESDCEGCTMGDVVQTAVGLGASSRLDPALADYASYYDRAEQIFRGQLVEQTFTLRPDYLALMRKCVERRVAKEMRTVPMSAPVKMETTSGTGLVQVSLGKFAFTPGVYLVRTESDGQRPFMLDSIEVKGSEASEKIPAATWMTCSQSDPGPHSKARVAPNSWNGASYNMCGSEITSGLRDGIPITARVPINLSAAGSFTLKAGVIKSADVGLIDFAIDGREVSTLDCYQPQTNDSWSLESVGSCDLAAGPHVVTLTWTSGQKNPSATGAEVFCDYITLDNGATKYDLEDYCQDSRYDAHDQKIYGWTLNCDTTCQPGFSSPALAYFVNGGTGMSVRTPFVVRAPGNYEITATAVRSRCDANGQASATLCQPATSSDSQTKEAQRRYDEMAQVASRMVGQQLGLCGFPDWVNKLPSDLDPEMPGIHMQGCCADATIRASHAIWSETVTGDATEARVNMAFNRKSPLVDVVSCLPHRGELDLTVHTAQKVLVRIPSWAAVDQVKTYVDREPAAVQWENSYVVFPGVKPGQRLTVTYPLRVEELKETVGSLDGVEYTERWRGNTIVDINPPGKLIPMYERPQLETDAVSE